MLSYADHQASILAFAETVPRVLLRHPETAHLAVRIAGLNLAEGLSTQFTVAIVGQMRVGKSTLLNALIGESLAPTGVTETTATVNWFRYGTGESRQIFRVHWNDGNSDDLPLSRIGEWIGDTENAARVGSIDFFTDAPFLKSANIVDTPGTRSVIEGHEAATQGFLAEKLERETLRHGGRADAVIYAINPVARGQDIDLLQFFGEQTRLPGASAYNSIAVVQKWEHLRPDPFAEVSKMCEQLRQQLQGKVAEVVPVSGLLAVLCRTAPLSSWHDLGRLVAATPAEVLDELMMSSDFFRDPVPRAGLNEEARVALAAALPWPAISFAVWVARSRGITSGDALRHALWEASGIDRLQHLLSARFFSLAGLIRAGTVLKKAWDPCKQAMVILDDVRRRQHVVKDKARSAKQVLDDLVARQGELREVLDYVSVSLEAVELEARMTEQVLTELHDIVYREEKNFRLLETDVAWLRQLEAGIPEAAPDEALELSRLFGQNGPDMIARIGLAAGATVDAVVAAASERHEYWSRRRAHSRNPLHDACDHARERLEMILDACEGVRP